jgi:methylthioribose-1-phosphate isomerase
MGLALGVKESKATGTQKVATEFYKLCELMADTRPTAVNLFWAIDRMKRCFGAAVQAGQSVDQIKDRLDREAQMIHDEDVASCRAMGAFGADIVPAEARILTHCNAGALATAGYGTALGVIRGAIEQGKRVAVFADETRPYLQGARLTAWELVRDGIDTTIITDNMSAALMGQGKVDLVVVGADRIAANGDTANKVGTYPLAVLAARHGIPFYVCAPTSSVDLATADGSLIEIEERAAEEVLEFRGVRVAPPGTEVRNPAFDVTPAELITGIVTEEGVMRAPFTSSLAGAVAAARARWAAMPGFRAIRTSVAAD